VIKKISLTGIKPTHMPHIGNYLGAIKPAIKMAESGDYECFYFIADYHSLTSVHKGSDLRQYILEIAAAWLASGLDPSKVTLYQQSHIPEILELHWILNCFTAKGLMNRAHAYKAIVQDNETHQRDPDQGVNMGLYSYPVLMAADILFLSADHVPVGADQVQHIEIARDIAMAFNHHYGELLKLPSAKVQQETGAIPGLDGRKMSKSYQNHIPLFLPQKQLQKMINRIVTDSTPPEEPKDPDTSLLFNLSGYFMNQQELADLREWYQRGISWGEAKAELFKVINRELEQPRARYEELMANPKKIHDVLEEGASRVRPRSQKLLSSIKEAIGIK
jgi:tryptophanyl-tRNA synthetase